MAGRGSPERFRPFYLAAIPDISHPELAASTDGVAPVAHLAERW